MRFHRFSIILVSAIGVGGCASSTGANRGRSHASVGASTAASPTPSLQPRGESRPHLRSASKNDSSIAAAANKMEPAETDAGNKIERVVATEPRVDLQIPAVTPDAERRVPAMNPDPTNMALDDAKILAVAHAIAMTQLAQARAALPRAREGAVRRLAERMLHDGERADRDLRQLGEMVSLVPVPSTIGDEVASRGEADLTAIVATSPAAFDRAFIARQIDSLRRIDALMTTRLVHDAHDDAVRGYMTKLQPLVERDLAIAMAIDKEFHR